MGVFELSRQQVAEYCDQVGRPLPPLTTKQLRDERRNAKMREERLWAHDGLVRRVGEVVLLGRQRQGDSDPTKSWTSDWRVLAMPGRQGEPFPWGALHTSAVTGADPYYQLVVTPGYLDTPPRGETSGQETAASFGNGIVLLPPTPFGERGVDELSLLSSTFGSELARAREVVEGIERVFTPEADLLRLGLES